MSRSRSNCARNSPDSHTRATSLTGVPVFTCTVFSPVLSWACWFEYLSPILNFLKGLLIKHLKEFWSLCWVLRAGLSCLHQRLSVCVHAPQQIFFVRKTGDYVGEAIVFGKIDSLEFTSFRTGLNDSRLNRNYALSLFTFQLFGSMWNCLRIIWKRFVSPVIKRKIFFSVLYLQFLIKTCSKCFQDLLLTSYYSVLF